MKKNKLILLIAIIMLAAAGLSVGAYFLFRQGSGQGDGTTESVVEPSNDPINLNEQLYWNVEKEQYAGIAAGGVSSRTPDPDDGYYHILFATNGRQVEYRVSDKKLVNQIDALDLMGLIFDENRIVVGLRRIEEFTGGYEHEGYYVSNIKEDGTVVLNSAAGLNGMDFEVVFDEGVPLYDVSGQLNEIGMRIRQTDLLKYDRIYTVKDLDGRLIVGYITSRYNQIKIYWNINRQWDTTLVSTKRMPDENGVYTYEMACEGEIVTVRTRLKEVADAIDRAAAKVVSLKFDKEGYAIQYVSASPYGVFGSWYHITELFGTRIVAHKYDSGSDTGRTQEGILAQDYHAYDMSGNSDFIGQEIFDLKVYDQVHCIKNSRGEVSTVFVISRMADSTIYWNMTRSYDAASASTLRKPDANGYYWFDLAYDGTVGRFRTNDKSIADSLDKDAARCFGLKLDGNTILKKYSARSVSGAAAVSSWYNVMSKLSNTDYHTKKLSQGSDMGRERTIHFSSDVKIYNVSGSYDRHPGELLNSLGVGDLIHCLTNLEGEVNYVMVIRRAMQGEIYWNLTRKYNSTTKETTRKPDASGYYVFRMSSGGKQVDLKTKDRSIASAVDSYSAGVMCLEVQGDLILKVGATNQKFEASGGTVSSWYDVLSITGARVYTKKLIQASDTGKEKTFELAPNCGIYNMGGEYEIKGEKTTLQVGDRVHVLLNPEGKASYVFIVNRPGKVVSAYCPDCDQTVNWTSYNGTFEDDPTVVNATGQHVLHYFLNGNRTTSGQPQIIDNTELHFDLNGHTLTGAEDNRSLAMFASGDDTAGTNHMKASTVRIVDNSEKKGGVLKSQNGKGTASSSAFEYGGVIWLRYSANQLHLRDVTLDFSEMNQERTSGAIYAPAGSKISMENVTVIGAKKALSGAVIYTNGSLLLRNTTIIGGMNAENGSVVLGSSGSLTVDGKTVIKDGKLASGGDANLYLPSGKKIATSDGLALGSEIHVSPVGSGVFTNNAFAEYIDYFVPDVEAEITANPDGALQIRFNLTGIEFPSDTLNLQLYETSMLSVNPVPALASLDTVSFESDDPSKVLVEENGCIKGISLTGDTPVKVTASTPDGLTATLLVTVRETDAGAHLHVVDTLAKIKEEDGELFVFEPFDQSKILNGPGGVYYMYLTEDVQLSRMIHVPDTSLVLCLNGHSITSVSGGRVIQNNTTTKPSFVKICDCSAEQNGLISGSSVDQGGAVWLTGATDLYLYGGTVTSTGVTTHYSGGGVIYANNFEMHGGTVKNGRLRIGGRGTSAGGGGANVRVFNTMTMTGGTIEGGEITLVDNSEVTFTGTTMSVFGGNVMAEKLIMSGGTIRNGVISTGNYTKTATWISGGNVYTRNLTMTGGTIEGGYAPNGGNIHILGNGGTIENATITGGHATAGFGGNLVLDQTSASLTLTNVTIADGSATTKGGNIRINGQVVLESGTIENSSKGNVFIDKGSFTMNGGTVQGGSAADGGNILVGQGTVFTMNGGLITNGKATGSGGNVRIENGGEMVMNGGTIEEPAAKQNVFINLNGRLTMTGGTIQNAKTNQNVIVNGTATTKGIFTMTGGTLRQTYGTVTNLLVYGTAIINGDAVIVGNPIKYNSSALNCAIMGGYLPTLQDCPAKIISGGYFIAAPGAASLASGYKVETLETPVEKTISDVTYQYLYRVVTE